jgi:urea transport system permease protein
VVFSAKTFFSENFPEIWLYLLGAVFILVVVFLPTGLAGLAETLASVLRPRRVRVAVPGRAVPEEIDTPVEVGSAPPA